MASMSGSSVQTAENLHKANGARACAESGLEIMRFWLANISISGNTPSNQIASQITSTWQSLLAANDVNNISPTLLDSDISIPEVMLNSTDDQGFSAVVAVTDPQTLRVDITGRDGPATRSIRVNYNLNQRGHTIFDFGVATRGPLSLSGNVLIEDISLSVGASVYIEGLNNSLALSITGNSQIADDVYIVNSIANVLLQGAKAGIGGQTGQPAIDNHVLLGAAAVEFPVPDPSQFEQYATSTIDSSTNTAVNATYENVRILAGTNPNFSGNITLKGVVFVESPNVVTFSGNTTIIGTIAGDGDVDDDSGSDQIRFSGNVVSQPVTSLPDTSQFHEIRNQTGTFVVAPGFKLSFTGNFTTLNGAIAGNGISFSGNAGGTIVGSIINYADQTMTVTGNSDLYFNRSGTSQSPAGFVPQLLLEYDPSSYSEVSL
jgi:hypothetical protein